MKRILLASAWFAVCAYSMVSLILGPSGVLATRDARSAAAAMGRNLERLQEINGELGARWSGLRGDPGSIALEGRSLGYLAVDEVAIRLPLVPPVRVADPGESLFYEAPRTLSEDDARGAAVAAGLFAGAGWGLAVLWRRRRSADGRPARRA